MRKTLATLMLITPGVALLGCAGATGDAPASRTRTTFDVLIVGEGDATSLASDHGATIALTEARISLGSLEWFEGDALFAMRNDTRDTRDTRDVAQRVVDSVLSVSSAHAHPGHYTPGEALADLGTVGVVNLLGAPFPAGEAEGLTGEYGTLSLPFEKHSELAGSSVQLAGTARVEDGEGDVAFAIALPVDAIIEGVPAAMEIPAGDNAGEKGTVTIAVSLEDLVRRIDFTVMPRDQVEPIDLMTVEQARNSVERSVQSQATYNVTYGD